MKAVQRVSDAERDEILARTAVHDCYEGQWTIHAPHDYEVSIQNWLGGGTRMVRCPGKTTETVKR